MMNTMLDRRQLLVSALACPLISACAATPRHAVGDQPWPLRVPLSAIGPEGYVVIEGAALDAPVLIAAMDAVYTAVTLVCTHRACEVYPRRDRLVCPCHGSQFGLRGELLRGPASAPLAQHAVRVDGDALVIERGMP